MQIETVKINGKEYPICCGLYALQKIQKKYEEINKFETKIINGDVEAIIDGIKIMNESGAKIAGTEPITEEEIALATNPFELSVILHDILVRSLTPENQEEENPEVMSQTETEE